MSTPSGRQWLAEHAADVPVTLREAMERAADGIPARTGPVSGIPEPLAGSLAVHGGAPADLARAALVSLMDALESCDDRAAAMPLLAADALVTAALESASPEGVVMLAETLRPDKLALLLNRGVEPVVELTRDALDALHAARLAEKRQALYYRSLASQAEDAGDAELSERLNGLHADEQHHLSRLTVRLVEFGESVADLGAEPVPHADLDGWEPEARRREEEETSRYESLLTLSLDDRTREMLEEFLAAERHHALELGGKWMDAQEGMSGGT